MPATDSDTRENSPAATDTVLIRSVALWGILFLMVMYTLYFAATLIMPIVLAVLLSLVLAPVVRLLVKLRIPQTIAALLLMLGIAASLAASVYALTSPASEWIERAPTELRELEYKLAWVKQPIEKMQQAKDQVDKITNVSDQSGNNEEVVTRQPTFSLVDTLLSRTPDLLIGIAIMLILLFFLLASGDSFVQKTVQITPRLYDQQRVVTAIRDIQRSVSVYLATITMINIALAIIIAAIMYLLGMPNPLLWGAMVGLLNYIPYLGVGISIVVVGFASLLSFDSLLQILLPPAAIFVMNVIEGQLITPIIAGRQLALSPVAVFLALVIMGWIWGIIGVFIAVPMLACIKLVCEQIDSLNPVAIVLSANQTNFVTSEN